MVALQVVVLRHGSHATLALAVCLVLEQHPGVPLHVLGVVQLQAMTPLRFRGRDCRLAKVLLLLVAVSGVFVWGRGLPQPRPLQLFGEPYLFVVHS